MTLLTNLLRRARHRDRSPGQSLVEFALLFPVFLILLMVAIDFGRVYLGYINLQQMARVGAGFASERASSWDPLDPDTDDQAEFQQVIANEAALINCELPVDGSGDVDVPDPAFPDGFDLGDRVQVHVDCSFGLITPVISSILGDTILVSASTTYVVREGVVSAVAGGGGPTVPPPVADFIGSPQTGFAPLEVTFTDLSTGGPTSWSWSFGNGNSFSRGPHTRTYSCTGLPGETCTYDVSLEVGSAGGFNTKSLSNYITVTVPPDTGPVAEFTATPRSGEEPRDVDFEFVENTTGVTYTNWEWDFDGDGTIDDSGETVSHTYATAGTYTVSLTVTDDTAATNTQTKVAYVLITEDVCVVPDFGNTKKNNAQDLWSDAGFTTNVEFEAGNGNYNIRTQTILGGTVDPQPLGCASIITVGP
ncbi:MAG TPA: PKD domain-containing protein [Candidatus Limnocylindrales bacterium]|nr:PKD domain-containing protein [Candidatus Limnocylindrales bacterium]